MKAFWGENFQSLTAFNSGLIIFAGGDRKSVDVLKIILAAIKLELERPGREALKRRVQDADEKRRQGGVNTSPYSSMEGVRVFFSEFSGDKNRTDADVEAFYKALIHSDCNANEAWEKANRLWRSTEYGSGKCNAM